ncbi:hypothetical protein HPB52_000364 [Rhipicephalus sanguineus]|uniref:Uncharacterized protein n=1 Tax=Rhipicephalus sanguineus TaxID=34632 RepID=A0A9D4T841_RHISA|nr:hypothetical protein HPB52_000364 [Rhipicephalus sanguineus]
MSGCGRTTDIVLICFNVESPDSLENTQELGRPELRCFSSGVFNVSAGKKGDQRNDPRTLQSLPRLSKRQEDYDR